MTLCSMAIKINVTAKDQEALNQVLTGAGYAPTRRKFHCTLGFIDKMIPLEEVSSFGQAVVDELQSVINEESPVYEVEKAVHLFKHVISFVPTIQSEESLKEINLWLWEKVQELSQNRWWLNEQTTPEKYKPHLTLGRARSPDRRFRKLEEFALTYPRYHLTQAAYVVFEGFGLQIKT